MVGMWIRKRLIVRAGFWNDYYDYISFVTEKIAYERTPLPEINRAFLADRNGEFARLLKGEETSVSLPIAQLTEIKEYVAGIGRSDADTQIASLQGKAAELKRIVEIDCDKIRKDGALYFKLSVLIGMVAFIILV